MVRRGRDLGLFESFLSHSSFKDHLIISLHPPPQARSARSEHVSSLLASYTAFCNIQAKAVDAREFYRKLEGQVGRK